MSNSLIKYLVYVKYQSILLCLEIWLARKGKYSLKIDDNIGSIFQRKECDGRAEQVYTDIIRLYLVHISAMLPSYPWGNSITSPLCLTHLACPELRN